MAAVPYSSKAPKARNPKFVTLNAGTELVRIYDPSKFGVKAITFRRNGPRARFDHHKYGKPREDAAHGVLYAAFEFGTSLVEIFGDRRLIDYGDWRVAIVTLTRDVNLLDLVVLASHGAGTFISRRPRLETSTDCSITALTMPVSA